MIGLDHNRSAAACTMFIGCNVIITSIGASAAVIANRPFAEGGMFQASALMMGSIGTVQLAAHGIALEVVALTFMLTSHFMLHMGQISTWRRCFGLPSAM